MTVGLLTTMQSLKYYQKETVAVWWELPAILTETRWRARDGTISDAQHANLTILAFENV